MHASQGIPMRRSDFSDIADMQVPTCWAMPRYRREYVPGGTFFFTVNLLERRRRLLVDHVDDLRASFRAAWLVQPFEVIAIVVLLHSLRCAWRLPKGDGDNAVRWCGSIADSVAGCRHAFVGDHPRKSKGDYNLSRKNVADRSPPRLIVDLGKSTASVAYSHRFIAWLATGLMIDT